MRVRVVRDWYGPVGEAGTHQFHAAGDVLDWPDGEPLVRHVEPLEPPKKKGRRAAAEAAGEGASDASGEGEI